MEAANSRASRRLHHLARHLGPNPTSGQEDHASWPSASLCRLACAAGSLESFQRRDNRTLFARQSSHSHGQFMRQVQAKEVGHGEAREDVRLPSVSTVGPAGDVSKRGSFSPTKSKKVASVDDGPGPSFAAVEPLFGRPAPETDTSENQVTDVARQKGKPQTEALCQESGSSTRQSNSEGAGSANRTPREGETGKKVSRTTNSQTMATCFGFEWFPRMDVVESGMAYVITIELPGVSADGIHVEVVRSSLIVTGSRATDWWKANNNGSNGGGTVYHRRELAQGPYRAVWRLPKNGDINGITAEFIDGFLRVLVPKIKVMTYL